jgi:hypothetical protein
VVSGYDILQEDVFRKMDQYSYLYHISELKKRQDELDGINP